MRCIDVLKRLEEEKGWDINKSQLLYYDEQGVVTPKRDAFFRRDYSESDYSRLKWAISLSKAHVSLPIITQILDLDKDIMELTAQALKEKSKSDWVTSEEIMERMKARANK